MKTKTLMGNLWLHGWENKENRRRKPKTCK